MDIELNKPFASDSHVDADDTRALKRSLNWLGYYTPPKKIGLSNIPDRGIFAAIKDFQSAQNIPATGEMRPGDATLTAVNKNLSRKLGGK